MGIPRQIPYQLIASDKANVTPGLILYGALVGIKHWEAVPWFVRWQLNHYTNWNLLLILLGEILQQRQWSPFLFSNSMGVLIGFRTGMANGISMNLFQRINELGKTAGLMPLTKAQFHFLDHINHTLPPVLLGVRLVRSRQRIPYITCVWCLVSAMFFAFRQQAKLDSSDSYVPHPWRRAWLGIVTGIFASPMLIDSFIRREAKKTLLILFLCILSWSTVRFDPSARKKYAFEYAVSKVNGNLPEFARGQLAPRSPKKTMSWSPVTAGWSGD